MWRKMENGMWKLDEDKKVLSFTILKVYNSYNIDKLYNHKFIV